MPKKQARVKRKKKPLRTKVTGRKKSFATRVKKYKGKKLGRKKRRVDPHWDLERDGITYSMISDFLGCRHRFHIGHVQGWRPKHINFPLEFGGLFHLMDEAAEKGVDLELMPKMATNYVNVRSEAGLGADELKELSMMAAVCAVTYRQYCLYWNDQPSMEIDGVHHYERDFHWLGKESNFDQEYRLPNGRVLRLRGKRDGDFKLTKAGGLWLFETKTKERIDPGGLSAGLHKDLQTGMYLLSQMLEHGPCPVGLLYNVIRRAALKPRKADTAKTFSDRVEQDIIDRPEWYFMRWSRQINRYELDEFCQRTLDPILFQICTWWDSIKRNPMNPFETQCRDSLCIGLKNPPKDNCESCNGTGVVSNPHHFERPFGVYDALAQSVRGPFFEIVVDDNYFMYEQKQHVFPELEGEDDVDLYLKGI